MDVVVQKLSFACSAMPLRNSGEKTFELLSMVRKAVSQHGVEYIQSCLDTGKVAT